MRIKLTFCDTSFEFEKDPLPPERFKTVCKLWGGVLYAGTVLEVVRMCGILGLALSALATAIVLGLLTI